ncbi:MAG: hypothetical protein IPG82_10310, partial [Saprospiraceae bacterium]|nr:hypothetical protein [Saprospiraceae bacterium]
SKWGQSEYEHHQRYQPKYLRTYSIHLLWIVAVIAKDAAGNTSTSSTLNVVTPIPRHQVRLLTWQ